MKQIVMIVYKPSSLSLLVCWSYQQVRDRVTEPVKSAAENGRAASPCKRKCMSYRFLPGTPQTDSYSKATSTASHGIRILHHGVSLLFPVCRYPRHLRAQDQQLFPLCHQAQHLYSPVFSKELSLCKGRERQREEKIKPSPLYLLHIAEDKGEI